MPILPEIPGFQIPEMNIPMGGNGPDLHIPPINIPGLFQRGGVGENNGHNGNNGNFPGQGSRLGKNTYVYCLKLLFKFIFIN